MCRIISIVVMKRLQFVMVLSQLILLDEDMIVRASDFGWLEFISETSNTFCITEQVLSWQEMNEREMENLLQNKSNQSGIL